MQEPAGQIKAKYPERPAGVVCVFTVTDYPLLVPAFSHESHTLRRKRKQSYCSHWRLEASLMRHRGSACPSAQAVSVGDRVTEGRPCDLAALTRREGQSEK